jgi:hydrogenase nickel incorporation protein HypA/HybF
VRRELRAHPGVVARTVRLRVGALRQVEPDTLRFCYDQAVRATELAASQLDLELIAARAVCRACEHEFMVAEQWFVCPACGRPGGEVVRGKELLLAGIECEQTPTLHS